MMLRARPTDPVLPLDAPPYCGMISPPEVHHSDLQSAAVPLGPPMRSLREMRRQADCICGTFLFLFFSLSLSYKLTSSVPTCDFPRFFFDFVQFSSHCLASFLSSLLLIAPFLVLPFYLSLLSQEPREMRPTRAPHTIKRLARARYTHGWPLLLGVCGPTSCRGPCHVAPRPQQHAARTGCALS